MTDSNKKLSNEVASPCIRNCCLNEDDVCLGCFRHVEEICEWGLADNERRKIILYNSNKRRVDHTDKCS